MVIKAISIAFGAVLLIGCGGGGSAVSPDVSPSPVAPVTQSTSLLPFKSVYGGLASPGTAFSFDLMGTDTAGDSYTGKYSVVSKGQVVFEGQPVYHVQEQITAAIKNGISINEVKDMYWSAPNFTLYKYVKSGDGDVFFEPSVRYLPDSMDVGYLMSSTTSGTINGVASSLTRVTRLDASGDKVNLVFSSSYIGGSVAQRDITYRLNSTGVPDKVTLLIKKSGASGVTINLQSS
jgi:hypothetical protein